MITPSYSPTATERVLPRLALDFTTGVLDPRVTVTRALNTATRVNSSGLIEIVNADLPRFDYSFTSIGTPRGLLIEETRSNICIRSSELNTGWSANAVNVTPNSTASPSGSVDADSVTALVGSAQHRLTSTQGTVSSGVSVTHSVFAKANTHSFLQLHDTGTGTFYANFDLSNGTVTAVSPANGATITSYGNGWYRCTLTLTTGATVSGGAVTIIPDGAAARNPTWTAAGTESIYAWGYQIEVGAFATSYIPTTTTSLTRNADAVGMTGTNFSDWFNASEGAFEAEYSSYVATNSSDSKGILAATDGTTGNRLYLNINTAGIPFFFVSASSSTQANISTGVTLVNDAVTRTTAAYKLNSFAAATNGTLGTPDTLGNVPTVNRLDIGSLLTSPQLNGHFRKLMYWPQRITNSETQAFSKG